MNDKKVKELDILNEIFDILGIKATAKVVDITNGKEISEVLNKIVYALNNVTTSREMVIAKNKIEEAIMWLEKDDKNKKTNK